MDVLAEKDDRVMMSVDLVGLTKLIENSGVVGIGSWSKIKRLRLNPEMMQVASEQRSILHPERALTLNAKTNIGIYRQRLENVSWCWALCLCREFDGG